MNDSTRPGGEKAAEKYPLLTPRHLCVLARHGSLREQRLML
jgi:hypothetical protein